MNNNKKGNIFKSFLITIGIIILILLAIAAYLYYVHSFSIFRGCVSSEEKNTMIPCTHDEECRELFMNNSNLSLDEMPASLREKIQEMLEEAVFCNQTCIVKEMYGDSFGEPVEECREGDKEFVLELKGKELINILIHYREKLPQIL